MVDDTTVIPPPTPLAPDEEDVMKREPVEQKTIGEVAQEALSQLQRKVKTDALKKKKH